MITIAALLVSWFVFTGLVRLLKVAVGTAIKIAAVLFIIQIFFGIGPETIWERLMQFSSQIFQTGK